MQIIHIEENQKEIWNKFIAENSSESFLQAWEWGEFQKSVGRKIWRLAVVECSNDVIARRLKRIPSTRDEGNADAAIPNSDTQNRTLSQNEINNEIATLLPVVRNDNKSKIQNPKFLALALIVKHDLPFGRSYLYCPRGPVIAVSSIKYQVSSILNLLFDEIKKIAKKEKAMFLKIDPAVDWNLEFGIWNLEPSVPLDRLSNNWNLPFRVSKSVACLSRNYEILKSLCWTCFSNKFRIFGLFRQPLAVPRSFGERGEGCLYSPLERGRGVLMWSQHWGFKKSPNEIQPKDTLILDLTKSEEELLKEMKQKTRYNIRLAEKKELRITNYELRMDNKKIFKEKFEEFWKLVEETSARDKFSSHSKDYYWKMLEGLSNPISTTPLTPTLSRGEREHNLQARLYLAEYENKIIAANIILYFGDMAVYLHGASSNEHRNIMAPYLLQWRQIMDAKNAGCKAYDFWGIASNLNVECGMWNLDSKFKHTPSAYAATPLPERTGHGKSGIINSKSNSWGGITRFKKGFGGLEKNYIGAYDLVFDNIGYRMYEFIKFIK